MTRATDIGVILALAAALAAPGLAHAQGRTPPAPAATAAPADAPVRYLVKPGDTLIGLSSRYLVKVGDYRTLQSLNKVPEPRHLRPGSTLTIPYPLLKTEVIAAQLGAYSGAVTITRAGRAVAATRGLALAEGDQIATGPNAFATLDLPDESRVSLPSNSTLKIARLRQVLLTGGLRRDFELTLGKGTASVSPLPTPDSQFLIRTPLSVAAVRGTEYRVAFDPARASAAAEVIKGVVGLAPTAGPPAETPVPAGFGARASAAGVAPPKPLLPAPTLVRGGRTQEDPQVAFAVEPVAGAGAYHLQLANDAGFVDVFTETVVPAPAASFAGVPDGTFFVRATAIDADGLEGLPRDYGFERDLNTLDAGAPAQDKTGKIRRFKFRWSAAGSGQRLYELQLFRGAETTPLVDVPGLTEPELSVTDLPPGAYHWRVVATRFKPGQPPSVKAGALQDLQIGE
ncbi:FecR domain-containing protein [Phenylobacterium aquaticum]|uniref:FecR domain-containing protein n=1 Tax=Phenylobacterium aquaticum TaxID=1763816 RepID=UPI0026ED80D9|nr:FecR domain-containing protein [Phenylobacterium aquaticum]